MRVAKYVELAFSNLGGAVDIEKHPLGVCPAFPDFLNDLTKAHQPIAIKQLCWVVSALE